MAPHHAGPTGDHDGTAPTAVLHDPTHHRPGKNGLADTEAEGDPKIIAAHRWSIGDGPATQRRVRKFRKIIDAGGMRLHPDHLEWLRYVLNWDNVDRSLPVPRPGGRWVHRAGRKSMSGYTVYYLELLMPTTVLLQQIMNYRLGMGRVLPKTATSSHPVSVASAMADEQGQPLLTLMHSYASEKGLADTLVSAHTALKSYRTKHDGWEPLRDLVYRDGVEDGGLWMQTVFAPIGPDGQPDEDAASASLAPADAASRKAVCDDRIDPEGRMATVPLLVPLRADVYGEQAERPGDPVSVPEAVGSMLGRLKTVLSVNGHRYLDQLDDEDRELLQTIVMPVRLVYAIEDSRGMPADVDAVAVFREIQEHFHGRDHLGHPEGEAERLVADKTRDALYSAVDTGRFTTTDPATRANDLGEPVSVAWTRPLLDVLAGHASYTELATLGLPATRIGAAVAAAMLVYGAGPERAVIGEALGSKRNRGKFDNVLESRRAALLREMTFPDMTVNTRLFEPVIAKDLMNSPPTGWEGDIDALITLVADGEPTAAQRALFDIVAIVAAAAADLPVVDLGSQGASRGFFRTKAINALRGLDVLVDKDRGRRRFCKDPAGRTYLRALLTGRLLTQPPQPQPGTDAPTTAQWRHWAHDGVGLLADDGTPVMHSVQATVVGELGEIVLDADGLVERTWVSVPQPAPRTAFDRFSTRNMQARAIREYNAGMSATPPPTRPKTADEQTADAVDVLAVALSRIDSGVSALEQVTTAGHILSGEHHGRIERVSRDLRNLTRERGTSAAVRLDDLLEHDDRRRAEHERKAELAAQATDGVGEGRDEPEDGDLGDGEPW